MLDAWVVPAARQKPRVDKDGNLVLFHGATMFALYGACFGMGLFLVYIALFAVDPATTRSQLGWAIGVIGFFLGIGLLGLLECFTARVTISDDSIAIQSWWIRHPKVMLWQDIVEIDYSSSNTFAFVVKDRNRRRLSVSSYLYGIGYFAKAVKQYCKWEVYGTRQSYLDAMILTATANKETNNISNVIATGEVPRVKGSEHWKKGQEFLRIGLIIILANAAFILVTMYLARNGGIVYFTWGLVLFGLVYYTIGIVGIARSDKDVTQRAAWVLGAILVLAVIGMVVFFVYKYTIG